jgi:2-dehydropantoate 2-reductase
MRPPTLAGYEGRLAVESAVLGDFAVDVPGASTLGSDIDVLWLATKATDLEPALSLAPPEQVLEATVIPLLNGVDHVAVLRARYPRVVAGAIRVESERLETGRIRQSSPFLRVELARDDELSLLWEKLAFLAPVALATTAFDAPVGAVRDDARFRGCQDEALAVARAEGARIDETAVRALPAGAPAGMRSSMQKDVEAGRPPELDAIAGPVLRGGRRHDIRVPSTQELADLVAARVRG